MNEEVREHIASKIREGFNSEADIVEGTVECFEGEADEKEVLQFTAELFRKHIEDQKSWPERTDCDRLDHAFSELDRRGIVARPHWTCCST